MAKAFEAQNEIKNSIVMEGLCKARVVCFGRLSFKRSSSIEGHGRLLFQPPFWHPLVFLGGTCHLWQLYTAPLRQPMELSVFAKGTG